MRKTFLAILLALALVIIPAGNAFAVTDADVEVTATPSVLSIRVQDKGLTPLVPNWIVNDVDEAGNKKISRSPILAPVTYYANPTGDTTPPGGTVADTDCHFTLFNDGDVDADITILMTDMDTMLNGELGYDTNGADSFGASAYIEGLAWDGAAVILTTGATAFLAAFATGDIDFGVALQPQSDSFTVVGDLTGDITLEATES